MCLDITVIINILIDNKTKIVPIQFQTVKCKLEEYTMLSLIYIRALQTNLFSKQYSYNCLIFFIPNMP